MPTRTENRLEDLLDRAATLRGESIHFDLRDALFNSDEFTVTPLLAGRPCKSLTLPYSRPVRESLHELAGYPAAALSGRITAESELAIVNELLAHELHRPATKRRLANELKLVLVEGEPVGLMSSKLHTISMGDFIQTVRNSATDAGVDLRQGAVRMLSLHNGDLDLATTFDNLTTEPRPGDIVSFGVRLRHSVLGNFASQVGYSAYRLVCSNGMTAPVCIGGDRRLRIRRGGDGGTDKTLARIREASRLAFGSLGERMSALNQLAEESMDLPRAIDQLVVSQRWSRTVGRELHAAFKRGEHSDESAFGLVNLLSFVGTHGASGSELPPSVRERLCGVAGIYAGRPIHQCKECHRILHPN